MHEDFFSRVNKTDTCWLWTGSKHRQGYGYFYPAGMGGARVFAHRYAYEITYGPIPKPLIVHHECEVEGCVNPEHLSLKHRSWHSRHHNPRQTYCARGHNLTIEANLTIDKHGERHCKPCQTIYRQTHPRHLS